MIKDDPLRFIFLARRGAGIRRWHTRPGTTETVGQHTYGVLVMVDVLTGGQASPALLRATLYHDTSEQATGDIPFPVKRSSPDIKREVFKLESIFNAHLLERSPDLTPEEDNILHWADMLDLLFFCYEQKITGNNTLRDVFFRGVDHLKNLPAIPTGMSIVNTLVAEFANEHSTDRNLYSRYLWERTSDPRHDYGL